MGRVYHQVLLIACLVTCLLAVICNAELHRAKVLPKTTTSHHHQVQDRVNTRQEIRKERKIGAEGKNLHHHQHYTFKKSKPTPILHLGHTSETWAYSIISAVLVGLSGIFPLLVIPLESGKALRNANGAPLEKLHLLLSFAVGGLLGDVFLHLLPEAWAHINAGDQRGHICVGLWVLTGIISFMLIEKVFPDSGKESDATSQKTDTTAPTHDASVCRCQHQPCQSQGLTLRHVTKTSNTNSNSHPGHCDCINGYHVVSNGQVVNGLMTRPAGEGDRSAKDTSGVTKQHIKTCGWLNLFANVVDNFTHGLAVAGSYCVGTKTGILTTLAILLHELPHEVGDFAILLRSGFDRWQAAKAQLITASGALIGALAALIAESAQEAGNRTAWILPFTAGGFIYIALVSLVPELLKENDWRESLKQLVLLCSGITVMALVTFLSD